LPGFVDSTVKDIDGRLAELESEVKKLQAARAALVGTTRGPGRPRGSGTAPTAAAAAPATTRRRRRGPGRPRGRRSGGTRAAQALDLVKSRPGVTIPEIAKELKIEPNYLYRVMPALVKEGTVKREGKGWHPA
jgi:hypothetical protein